MPADSKEVLHGTVDGRETLRMGDRLEAPHLPLALVARLMGDFGSIIGVLVRAMSH